jgi:Tfp pilus assembly protein PilF
LFLKAIDAAPARADIRKNLAYTYLKVGETEAARDQFGEAMRLDPGDHHVALEYAFLCYETKQQAVARRIFDRIRKSGNPVAEQAFQNIDRPLAEGIERWKLAVEAAPDRFSGHEELAKLAEQRDELELAARHYEIAWKLRPDMRAFLLDLGRVWQAIGRGEEAAAALLAASRSPDSRVAETARELVSSRYPYVYEFRLALDLDPKNIDLRRELAYLLLQMDKKDEAEREFEILFQHAPDDLLCMAQLGFLRLGRKDVTGALPLLERVIAGPNEELADRARRALGMPQTLKRRDETPRQRISEEAKLLAEKSLERGYLRDALKYLTTAHETDPVDFSVILKLGWTNNLLRQDREAMRWFGLARKSPDPAISSEAARAYNNLRPAFAPFRVTAWAFPFYSSRWKDVFTYAQVKTEFKLGSMPFRPYVSMRFAGDVRRTSEFVSFGQVQTQLLSESAVILGAGVATSYWHGLMAWGEAGSAVSYLRQGVRPDYRGGLSFSKGFGELLGGESKGVFYETNEDAVFVSRFGNDTLFYTQNRLGYTLGSPGGLRLQLYWNQNVTVDTQRQYWANFVETGPGVRFRWNSLPPAVSFSINALKGRNFVNEGNPRSPNYFDFRAGVWYAITH